MATLTWVPEAIRRSTAVPVDGITPAAVRQTRVHFFLIWAFLLAQAYTIPVLPIGPSWAIWPGIADFFMMALFPAVYLWRLPQAVGSKPNNQLLKFLIYIFLMAVHSVLLFRFVRVLNGEGLTGDPGFMTAIYQVYRLVQFFFMFWVVSRIPFTEARKRILVNTLIVVMFLIAAGIMATYTQIVPTITFVNHLPGDKDVSGPWNIYWTYTRLNLSAPFGTVGYNHSYTGMQILLMLAFYFHLRDRQRSPMDVVLMGVGVVTVFLSESRAGLATLIMFCGIYMSLRPVYLFLAALGLLTLIFMSLAGIINLPLDRLISEETLERTATILDAANAENLSGRDTIWQDRVDFLNQDLSYWLVGTGFGNTYNSGNNAHMLPLQIIIETGIFGLSIFCALAGWVLWALWRYDRYMKPIFWCTIALLVSCITQETFYPVPSAPYFVGFYLLVVAITLRQRAPDVDPDELPPPAKVAA
ncbi:MAG: O-antigen ligase family protein [Anaerolineae bacterium]|nr:O-antigen ligase family protein [Anaerolineae bacterium]